MNPIIYYIGDGLKLGVAILFMSYLVKQIFEEVKKDD